MKIPWTSFTHSTHLTEQNDHVMSCQFNCHWIVKHQQISGMENEAFWLKLEELVKIKIHSSKKKVECLFCNFILLFCVLQLMGFGRSVTFEDNKNEDIDKAEEFVRTELMKLLKQKYGNNEELFNNFKTLYCGDYVDNPESFQYSQEERALIFKYAKYAKYIVSVDDITLGFNEIEICEKIAKVDNNVAKKDNDLISETKSLTHYLLSLLLSVTDKNFKRQKEGYRFDERLKKLAAYYRMTAGCLAYETLQKNLELCLPSLSSVNRYIRKMNTNITEGVLRTQDLVAYLKQNGIPPVVALSEDLTRLTGVVQYDVRTNSLMGFALPIHQGTGMPIPFSFKAWSAGEIIQHFERQNSIGNFVNVVVAQPLANVAPFCLLLYATDTKYTSLDVSNRWDYIVKNLAEAGVEVLILSTDSDPKYNSSQRRALKLGEKCPLFPDKDCFSCGISEETIYGQDTEHIGTKLRNQILKTKEKPRKLAFGKKYFVRMSHLEFLVENFSKDQHQLKPSVLNPIDRMNYSSVLRICNQKVIDLLKIHVKNNTGTVTYLGFVEYLHC